MDDYSSSDRFVRLANGNVAVLATCYDLFGMVAQHSSRRCSVRNLRALLTKEGRIGRRAAIFKTLSAKAAHDWRKTLDLYRPRVALAAIHVFRRPGREGYWQRHGIAAASAKLDGGLIVGASHFLERLPHGGKAVLASRAVPKRHINQGTRRRSWSHHPILTIHLDSGTSGALVRLFVDCPAYS